MDGPHLWMGMIIMTAKTLNVKCRYHLPHAKHNSTDKKRDTTFGCEVSTLGIEIRTV